MTDQTFLCPHCQKEIALTEALSHQLQDKMSAEYEKRLATSIKEVEKEHEASKEKLQQQLEEKLRKQVELEMKDKANESAELEKRNKEFQTQILELTKQSRELKKQNEERELELQKKLAEGEDKIRQEVMKKSDEEHRLKEAEKEKIINDLKTALEDARRKASQGSQQTQGEVLELELENILRREFPLDTISEIKKGIRGADILQEVIDRNGRVCGKILWESKNAEWSAQWPTKLREDQRTAKADLCALVSVNLPEGITSFIYKDGVWLCSVESALALAYALRFNLVQMQQIKIAAAAKGETKEELYDYITGMEFKYRVEAMVEAYQGLLDDVEKEKRWFSAKWAKQEKSIRTLLDQTGSFHGELESIVGAKLPSVKQFTLEDAEQEKLLS